MAWAKRSNLIIAVALLAVTAFSCTLPGLTKRAPHPSQDKSFQHRPAKVSGLINLEEGCGPGYYQIRLQGMFDGANVQVESQSDQAGRFSLVAPAGRYL